MDFWASLRLRFDIAHDPPGPTELDTLRKTASPRNLQLVVLCGIALGVAIGALLLDALEWPLPFSMPVAVLLGVAVALPFVYWVKIADILAGVAHPLGRDEVATFREWSRRDERVAAYFQKILRQGRRPVYGDFAALLAWIGGVTGCGPVSTSGAHSLR